ncbi:exocyst complex component 4-like [Limulus polyphemus]|uniref:Exocyst complex component Sec8 n=1 Tax=Limulus polyphemus TaxID=6850 RepID=A0ABM1TNL4_LIMPO|nr:exocyst complex component 4-like [Limulus polyphemus]
MNEMDGPMRPPRGTKPPRESSGLLMSVIRALSASQNNADRDREKAKLEKEFKRSDQRLDDLVAGMLKMLVKQELNNLVAVSREQIQNIKDKLKNCKMLLHCKRDELKKLWLEAVEQKQVLSLLQEIERLLEVPYTVERYLAKKHYLHATQLLVSSVSLLEGSLEGVDALKEVKSELLSKKEQMHEILLEDLHKHLYQRSTTEVLRRFKRQGSERRSHADGIAGTPSKRTGPFTDSVSPGTLTLEGPVMEDVMAVDPEGNSPHFIAILVECLSLLNKVPEAVEDIKSRSQKELMAIVRRTAQHVLDTAQNFTQAPSTLVSSISGTIPIASDDQVFTQPQLLMEMLEVLFEQFRCVTRAHKIVLDHLRRIGNAENSPGEVVLYELADIWSKIQAVLEILVGEYLDIHNTTSTPQNPPPAFTEATATSGMASYFAKRRNIKPKKFALFRFDRSSHAISMNTYLQEQNEAIKEKNDPCRALDSGQQILVCQPTTKNITVIFKPLSKFIVEIENALELKSGNHCPLHSFLSDCVKVFLGQVNVEVETMIDTAIKTLDSWKVTLDPAVLKQVGVNRPLLQSTVSLNSSVQELQNLMFALPMYADYFLNLICSMLQNYKETCQAAYRGIVQPESEDKRIISATWAKDEDISRFLRSLPNWMNLQHLKENKEGPDVEELPEEVRLRNKKESEILTGNLAGDTLIPQHEILSDTSQLRILAQLQESLVRGAELINDLYELLRLLMWLYFQELPLLSENSVITLKHLAKEFEELSSTCLLVLHLEVRVHCFYYLLPVAIQGSFALGVDSQEPDPEVLKLNKDLSNIDEAMTASLQTRKLKYIFEGLGHLVSAVLINSASTIKRINENGVKRMCRNIFAIQQNLTTITMSREVALDHARQYFELFYHTPEEVLNTIMERGPQFQEIEYVNVLQLIHRSQPGSDPTILDSQLSRLQEILNEVAVAV